MKLTHVTFSGPPIDDLELLPFLPVVLRTLLEQINGYVQFGGGLHVRGASSEPQWHSLRRAWKSEEAFHRHYPAVMEEDIPFGQDCVGDQFLLRGNSVVKLFAETGDIEDLSLTLRDFLEIVQAEPVRILCLAPLLQFEVENRRLMPGELLSVYPPFCTEESTEGVKISAIRAEDRLSFLSQLSRQLQSISDGTQVEIVVQGDPEFVSMSTSDDLSQLTDLGVTMKPNAVRTDETWDEGQMRRMLGR